MQPTTTADTHTESAATTPHTIGARIQYLRKEAGANQREFSRRLGVSQQFLSMLERGNVRPSAQLTRLIALVCNVRLEWLETGEGLRDTPAGGSICYARRLHEAYPSIGEILRQRQSDTASEFDYTSDSLYSVTLDELDALRDKLIQMICPGHVSDPDNPASMALQEIMDRETRLEIIANEYGFFEGFQACAQLRKDTRL